VTDTGNFTAQQSFKITVNKVDSPPLVAPINQINVIRGDTVSLVANGTDADLPFAGITYSLDAGAPAGATIDPETGAFNWQVPANYPLGKTTITIRVTDKTETALSATTTIEIVVSPIPTEPGSGVGVDDDLLEELARNPGVAALLVGPFNALGNLPTIPSGPAVLQQLAKVAVDRAVVGLNESGNELFSGFIDLLGPLDHGLSHDTEQMELERAGLNEEVAGDGEQQQGDATKASHVEPIDVKGLNNEKSPPPRQRVRDAGAGAHNSQNQLQQHGQLKINVAPQAKAWPTAQSFKSQLQKAEASKLQAAKAQATDALTSRTMSTQPTASNSTSSNLSGTSKTSGRDEQSTDRASERTRGKIATAVTAAMIPLLIGQLEARDKMAERNRKQGRGR
jgi:hypothetical protein